KGDKKPHRVEEKDISKFAKSLKAPHIITSALTGSNVTDLFELIGGMAHKKVQGLVPKDHDWSMLTKNPMAAKKSSKSSSTGRTPKKATKGR
ncbi:MAG: hypothetical protein ACFFEA_05155, partial [Candidatus Thorarchaeota archaeon]